MKIVVATHWAIPEYSPSDRLLAEALEARGVTVAALPWDAIDPAEIDCPVCIRSTWDYFLRIETFRAWVSAFKPTPKRLWNPPDTVLWNLDKHYLLGLEKSGIVLPVTRWIPPGETPDLAALFRATGWSRAVLKPRVSASSHGTILVTPASMDIREHAAHLAANGALLQEFIPEIAARGEMSLIFFGGEFSHAVCKEAAVGEFRVQSQFGGGARLVEVSPALLRFGELVLAAVSLPWVYARIDVVDAERGPLLMELELIEPELFFHLIPARAGRLADCLLQQLSATHDSEVA